MFPELKGFLLVLYSDDELYEMKFPRFRCGMEEIQELERLYWRHERSFSDTDGNRDKSTGDHPYFGQAWLQFPSRIP